MARITLHAMSDLTSGACHHVDADTADELQNILYAKGVKSCSRYSRCNATWDGASHGPTVAVNELTVEDFDWLCDTDPCRTRMLFCNTLK